MQPALEGQQTVSRKDIAGLPAVLQGVVHLGRRACFNRIEEGEEQTQESPVPR